MVAAVVDAVMWVAQGKKYYKAKRSIHAGNTVTQNIRRVIHISAS